MNNNTDKKRKLAGGLLLAAAVLLAVVCAVTFFKPGGATVSSAVDDDGVARGFGGASPVTTAEKTTYKTGTTTRKAETTTRETETTTRKVETTTRKTETTTRKAETATGKITSPQKLNYMKAFPGEDGNPSRDGSGMYETVYGSSRYDRGQIYKIVFENTLSGVPSSWWDVSRGGDGSVRAYATYGSSASQAKYVLHIAADGPVIAPEDCTYLFSFPFVTEIGFSGNFLTYNTIKMDFMFAQSRCDYFDLTGFDTSKVTSMKGMFSYTQAQSIGYGKHFDTSNVTDMSMMFNGCRMVELSVRVFDTSKVRDMSFMFSNCQYLYSIDISNFDISSLQKAKGMFDGTPAKVVWNGSQFWG